MKSVVINLMAILLLAGTSAQADEMKNLKLRIEGHIETLMSGERAPMLAVKDYYSTVYLTSKATVEELVKLPNGNYSVRVKFETTGRIHQDAEQTPLKKSELKKKEDIKVQLTFKVEPKAIKWIEKLETPFVKSGSEARYILEMPGAKPAGKVTSSKSDAKSAKATDTKPIPAEQQSPSKPDTKAESKAETNSP